MYAIEAAPKLVVAAGWVREGLSQKVLLLCYGNLNVFLHVLYKIKN